MNVHVKRRTRKALVIVGPTAVGKSALAVLLAKKCDGEIVSADSRQVYKGLDIGTGKITKKEMLGVRHHLLDVADPKRQYSVARYVKDARKAINDIVARGKLPIICGGTGLYIDALLGEIRLSPAPPNPRLRTALAKKATNELFLMLQKLDAARVARIDRHNPRRLIRAIEIAISKDGKAEPFSGRKIQPFENFEVLKIGLALPPEKLKEKIRKRLVEHMKKGMIAEAEKLHQQGLSWKRTEELGLEYRYLARFLRGKISKNEMMEKLTTEIWHYAKRQMTWFKRDGHITWFLPHERSKIMKAAAIS